MCWKCGSGTGLGNIFTETRRASYAFIEAEGSAKHDAQKNPSDSCVGDCFDDGVCRPALRTRLCSGLWPATASALWSGWFCSARRLCLVRWVLGSRSARLELGAGIVAASASCTGGLGAGTVGAGGAGLSLSSWLLAVRFSERGRFSQAASETRAARGEGQRWDRRQDRSRRKPGFQRPTPGT